ncbi:hypothetical protein QAD02_010169 [Eretmocerus hayati]|uniref:Uncharacterized protein n=1 Tax=Eretmocerus hayati TaxID=131215 RepID=A0ACC2NC51_9HYME|nr:hypothetical protein QAD02_010169 [Eretmocerus hayati]
MWLTLAERHLEQRGVDWKQAEKLCFNEWSNPDDEELGIQIVKDLHRTGCSLFCGAAGRDNQVVLRRVLLGFARWNKSVGYCQGLNVLAAQILQVVDRDECAAVKVMIHLIEGVLPEAYFAENLRGLSVDMAVFRDLLRYRLPKLSKHLESLQFDPKDKSAGSSYEPPLTNVFTMQWFLTLFCHCLPQDAVLRVWDLIFLEGDDVLLRTALAIWEGISDRIMTVTSADEFYSIMGVLTREMLEFTDTNHLIKSIVEMGQLQGITNLREKHRYNITPWARRLSDDEDTDTEDDDRLAVAAAAVIFAGPRLRKSDRSSLAGSALQTVAPSSDRERLALDISTLKQQYAKLRERQRQAHIIFSAACARQSMVGSQSGRGSPSASSAGSAASQAMNHLLVDETVNAEVVSSEVHHGEEENFSMTATGSRPGSSSDTDDSTSTELCDEPDRSLSDLDIGDELGSEPRSLSSCEPQETGTIGLGDHLGLKEKDTSIADLTDQIRRLSADDAELKGCLADDGHFVREAELSSIPTPVSVEDSSADSDDRVTVSGSVKQNESFEKLTSPVKIEDECSELYQVDKNEVLKESIGDEQKEVDISAVLKIKSEDRTDNLSETVGLGSPLEDVKSPHPTRTSFVIGHLPIAPAKIENLKRRVSPEVFASKQAVPLTRKENGSSKSPDSSVSGNGLKLSYGTQLDLKHSSPKSPESAASFSSGETMGPDSVVSSLAATPMRSESHNLLNNLPEKSSLASSISSESHTLTCPRSPEPKSNSIITENLLTPNQPSPVAKSVSPSLTDSLAPQDERIARSSSESLCSPSLKLKSSERDFSSELQSPVSTSSIRFTTGGYISTKPLDGLELQKTAEIGQVTSPFYPILNPHQNTPSPNADDKSKLAKDIPNHEGFRGIPQEQDVKLPIKTKRTTPAFDVSQLSPVQTLDTLQSKPSDGNISIRISESSDPFDESPRRKCSFDYNDDVLKDDDSSSGMGRTSAFEKYRKYKFEDELQETDTLSPLPLNQFENRSIWFERTRGSSLDGKLETLEISGKSYERTNSSLGKRFPDMLLSPSLEDFANSSKKRSSDVLEDLRHLETKTTEDGEIDPSKLTRKTSIIWEDLKSLEARRQDTFSDSASGFSRQKVEVPGICVSTTGRKTYVVEPKINIDENSDSLLKSVKYQNSNGTSKEEENDEQEPKLGVWTKVQPRKRADSGRRSSDRAKKIIQENSAILQKILDCQAKKRMPDLEEISKQITISPINEEISKIFSPILEKMGLNEHEINEELARISFKDVDRNTTTTTASEFEAKINEELSKLSLIGDNEEVAYLPDVEELSSDYLLARDAFIDRQMNAELSKLLAHYDLGSPAPIHKVSSSNLNASADVSTCSTNIYSYQSSNDSLNIKSDLGSKDTIAYPDKSISNYASQTNYNSSRDISARSDVDIRRELEKLDHISQAQALPSTHLDVIHPDIVPKIVPYIPDVLRSPKIDYPRSAVEKQSNYDLSPMKSPYSSPYSASILQDSTYDYKSRISPRRVPNNPYSPRSYDSKNDFDTGFENSTFELTARGNIGTSALDYNYGSSKHNLSKERLEFRVKYDTDDDLITAQRSTTRDINLKLSPFSELENEAMYRNNNPASLTPTNKYPISASNGSPLISSRDRAIIPGSDYQRTTYGSISPAEKYASRNDGYNVHPPSYRITQLDPDTEISSYLANSTVTSSSLHRDSETLSPHYRYDEYKKSSGSPYRTTASPGFENSLSTASIRSKTVYSDVNTPVSAASYKSVLGDDRQIFEGNGVGYGYDGGSSPSKSMAHGPFPVRNVQRKPKEVAVRLGLYSPTYSIQSKRS